MNRIRLRVAVIFLAILRGTGAHWIARAGAGGGGELVFAEDFSTDPGWMSEDEMYVF